jgi:hypothetical protein
MPRIRRGAVHRGCLGLARTAAASGCRVMITKEPDAIPVRGTHRVVEYERPTSMAECQLSRPSSIAHGAATDACLGPADKPDPGSPQDETTADRCAPLTKLLPRRHGALHCILVGFEYQTERTLDLLPIKTTCTTTKELSAFIGATIWRKAASLVSEGRQRRPRISGRFCKTSHSESSGSGSRRLI